MAAQCRDCGQEIAWATSASTGRPVPLDLSPDDRLGTVRRVVTEDRAGHRTVWAHHLTGSDLAAAIADGALLFTRHRDTCSGRRPHNPKPAHIHAPTPRRSIARRPR